MGSLNYHQGGYEQFSQDALEQILALKRLEEGSTDDSQPHNLSPQKNTFLFTINAKQQVIAFAEVELCNKRAVLQNLIVESQNRRKGLGSQLLSHCFTNLSKIGVMQISVQTSSMFEAFFTRFGFVTLNHSNDGKRCQMLQPSLAYFVNNHQEKPDKNEVSQNVMKLGQDSNQYPFNNIDQYTDLHRVMLTQARKRIWILAPNIECPVINSEDTSQSIYRLIKRNPDAEIKILLTNDRIGAGYFNPCISMAQRLSSYVEIRQMQQSGTKTSESMTLVDYCASIFRKHSDNYTGFACFNNRLLFDRLTSSFNGHWQFASPSLQHRRLVI